MLKKLSKYGNSTTLVIDKAILELLNMQESGMVRLSTDGKSLIVTPVATKTEDEKISYSFSEAMNELKTSYEKKAGIKQIDVNALDENKQKMYKKMQAAFAETFAKHQAVMTKFNTEVFQSEEFQEKVAELAQKIDPAEKPEEYTQAFEELKFAYCPEMKQLQNEIKAISEKYAV